MKKITENYKNILKKNEKEKRKTSFFFKLKKRKKNIF
jgi:hypothetical protein